MNIPNTQEEWTARIEEADRYRNARPADTIIGMLRGKLIGGTVSPLTAESRYTTQAWMTNPAGVTHGGMIATMFDNAMGSMAHLLSPAGYFAPTGELHISYIKPVPLEETFIIRVRADQAGLRMIRMRAELRKEGDEDTIYATAFAINCPVKASK